jgi:hypothetical protein
MQLEPCKPEGLYPCPIIVIQLNRSGLVLAALIRDAPEVLVCPNEKLSVTGCDGRIAPFTQRIYRQELEFGTRLENEAIATLSNRIAPVARQQN